MNDFQDVRDIANSDLFRSRDAESAATAQQFINELFLVVESRIRAE